MTYFACLFILPALFHAAAHQSATMSSHDNQSTYIISTSTGGQGPPKGRRIFHSTLPPDHQTIFRFLHSINLKTPPFSPLLLSTPREFRVMSLHFRPCFCRASCYVNAACDHRGRSSHSESSPLRCINASKFVQRFVNEYFL